MALTRIRLSALGLVALLSVGAGRVLAVTAYSQNFDSGSATYTTNDPYWVTAANDNGIVHKSTDFPDWSGDNPPAIPVDVSGSGYFLFLGTAGSPTKDQFFISPTFTVIPNATYTISFSMTNALGGPSPQVQPQIGGTLLGAAPVAPNGFYQDGIAADKWQLFTYSWNSGSNTSASLILHDFLLDGVGNDFGVDAISVTTTAPEPTAIAFLGIGGLSLLRRRRGVRSQICT